jgi:uncharacterized radical SAM superfamily Fe-S cluster-containing enzyme
MTEPERRTFGMNAHSTLALALPMPHIGQDLCCKCRREVTVYVFVTDGYRNATYHCPTHGDVAPLRSRIIRPESVN